MAFRVIADHIRTLSFAIADGIEPGNTDRHYVLRRILRRAVRYGRTLGFREPFFYKLVAVLARTMGDVFPEIREKQQHVEDVLRREEEAFNKTLDRGIEEFNLALEVAAPAKRLLLGIASPRKRRSPGHIAFELYDTYGFPLDLTELMARERGMSVDVAGFEKLMEEQRARARQAQKKEIISVSEENLQVEPTKFLGYDFLETEAVVESVAPTAKSAEIRPDRGSHRMLRGNGRPSRRHWSCPCAGTRLVGARSSADHEYPEEGQCIYSSQRAGLTVAFPRWVKPCVWPWTRSVAARFSAITR